jgi:hypothetical protein
MLEAPSHPPKRKGGEKREKRRERRCWFFKKPGHGGRERSQTDRGGGQGQIEREQGSEDVHRRYNIILTYTW